MEINKILTISTAHVNEQTLMMLACEPTSKRFPFIGVYPKSGYGYFVYINKDVFEEAEMCSDTPKDLAEVINFTIGVGCDILCLDCDGEELQELRTYLNE